MSLESLTKEELAFFKAAAFTSMAKDRTEQEMRICLQDDAYEAMTAKLVGAARALVRAGGQ
jgi:hypothetical protein